MITQVLDVSVAQSNLMLIMLVVAIPQLTVACTTVVDQSQVQPARVIQALRNQVGVTASADHQKSTTALARAEEAHKILDVVAISLLQAGVTTSAFHQKSTTALASAVEAHKILDVVAISLLQVGATTSAFHQKSTTALASVVETHRILDVAVDNYLQYQMGIVTLAQVPQFVRPLHVCQIFSTPTTMLGTDVKRLVL